MRYCDWCGKHTKQSNHNPIVVMLVHKDTEVDNTEVDELDLCFHCIETVRESIKEYIDECRTPPNIKTVRTERGTDDSEGQTEKDETDTYSLNDEAIRQNKILGHSSHSSEKRD